MTARDTIAREAFEKWTKQHEAKWDLGQVRVNGQFGRYYNSDTDTAWMGFEAAWLMLTAAGHRIVGPADMEAEVKAVEIVRQWADWIIGVSADMDEPEWPTSGAQGVRDKRDVVLAALASPRMPVPADGPVPTHECPFHVGQPVRLANPYAEEDPEAVFYVTGISWEHRMVRARGWNIMIASKEDIEKGYGQTDGFVPDDLLAASRAKGGA